MSVSVSTMIGSGCDLQQVAESIGHVIGQSLEFSTNEWGPIYTIDTMGISITAYSDHGLVDDQGIDFTQYPIEVQFNRYAGPDADLRAELCQVFALRIANKISSEYGCKCLVVYESQRILKCFGDT